MHISPVYTMYLTEFYCRFRPNGELVEEGAHTCMGSSRQQPPFPSVADDVVMFRHMVAYIQV